MCITKNVYEKYINQAHFKKYKCIVEHFSKYFTLKNYKVYF